MNDDNKITMASINTNKVTFDFDEALERYGEVELNGATPNDRLELLVEKWRDKAEQKYGVGGLLAADELEDVINGYD